MSGQWKRSRAYFPERFLPVLTACEELSSKEGVSGDINQYILEGLMRVLEFRGQISGVEVLGHSRSIKLDRERLAKKYLGGALDENGKF